MNQIRKRRKTRHTFKERIDEKRIEIITQYVLKHINKLNSEGKSKYVSKALSSSMKWSIEGYDNIYRIFTLNKQLSFVYIDYTLQNLLIDQRVKPWKLNLKQKRCVEGTYADEDQVKNLEQLFFPLKISLLNKMNKFNSPFKIYADLRFKFAEYYVYNYFPNYIKDLDAMRLRLPVDVILYRGGCRVLKEVTGPTSFSYSPRVAQIFCKGTYYKIIFPKGTSFLPIFMCGNDFEKEILILEPGRLIEIDILNEKKNKFTIVESFFEPDSSRRIPLQTKSILGNVKSKKKNFLNLIEKLNNAFDSFSTNINNIQDENKNQILNILKTFRYEGKSVTDILYHWFSSGKEANLKREFNLLQIVLKQLKQPRKHELIDYSGIAEYFILRRSIEKQDTDIMLKKLDPEFFEKIINQSKKIGIFNLE